MADTGDHRYARGDDGSGDDFLVERPQILHGAAAAADEDYVRPAVLIQTADGLNNFLRRARALHRAGGQQHAHVGIAPPGNADDIANHRAAAGCGHANHLWQQGDGPLAGGVEQPLLHELLFQRLKAQIEISRALGPQGIDIELIAAALYIQRGRAARRNAHAVLRSEGERCGLLPPKHALHARGFVLEGKIAMAAGIAFEARYLAAHSYRTQHRVAGQLAAHIFIQLCDG